MSFHGTNSPRSKPLFSKGATGSHSIGNIFMRAGSVNIGAEPSGVYDAELGATLTLRPAGGIQSYWKEDAPADFRMSGPRMGRMAIKRVIDIVVASMALFFLLPLMVVVAVAIKVSDPGPALFRQSRLGRDGKSFKIFKFRSMYLAKCSSDGVAQTVDRDSRVMPLGAFIRRTSIDELPQLINVLIGDMSLVGPRPHVEGQLAGGKRYDEVLPYYSFRLKMRPGLTGWAQANGYRGPTDNASRARLRIEYDVAYIQNFSCLLDLRIMMLTLRREFIGGTGF